MANARRVSPASPPRRGVAAPFASRGIPPEALVLGLSLWVLLSLALPDNAAARNWRTMLTTHCILFYEDEAELKRLEQALQLDPVTMKTLELAGTSSPSQSGMLGTKVDFIFERVQTVLDMRQAMPRVNIRIYDGKLEIRKICPRCRVLHPSSLRSWYVFEQKSVYLSLDDIRTGILVHEIAHHVIDHYFMARPDAASAEILAVFAEKNFAK